jgi:hypothetical protein
MISIEYPPVWTRCWRWIKRLFRKQPPPFTSFAMPLIKNFDYQNMAELLMNVQPMNVPNGVVFYMDYKCSIGKEPWYKRLKVWIFGKPTEGCCRG